jgi:hypothetical protein
VSSVVALFAFVQAVQTLPVVSVVEGEETWLALTHAKFCSLSCAIRKVLQSKAVHVPAVVAHCASVLIGALIAARGATSAEKIIHVF